jgi:serine/threonine protein kinase
MPNRIREFNMDKGMVIQSHETTTHYRLDQLLGEGAFGQVWLASVGGEHRAVKVVHEAQSQNAAEEIRKTQLAAEAVGVFYVPRFYEACWANLLDDSRRFLLIATEYIDGGSAAARLNGTPFPSAVFKVCVHDCLLALGRLHAAGIIHRDVKPENILLSPKSALLCDFGVSKILQRGEDALGARRQTVCGTAAYMAPEVCAHYPYSCKVDIWSMGWTALHFTYGQHPWGILANKPQLVMFDIRLERYPKMPDWVMREPGYLFFQKCTIRNPDRRPSAPELLPENGATGTEREKFRKWVIGEDPNKPDPNFRPQDIKFEDVMRNLMR